MKIDMAISRTHKLEVVEFVMVEIENTKEVKMPYTIGIEMVNML